MAAEISGSRPARNEISFSAGSWNPIFSRKNIFGGRLRPGGCENVQKRPKVADDFQKRRRRGVPCTVMTRSLSLGWKTYVGHEKTVKSAKINPEDPGLPVAESDQISDFPPPPPFFSPFSVTNRWGGRGEAGEGEGAEVKEAE